MLAVVGAGVVAACQIGKVPSALPAIRADLGLDLPQAAWVVSIFNFLGMVLGMACGAAGDRLGHRRVVLAGLAALAASSLLGAVVESYAGLLAARVLEGLAFTLVVASAPPLFLRFSEERHARLIYGLWGGYWPAGVAVMVLVTPLVLDAFGWRGLWGANGALTALYAALVAWATRGAPVRDPRSGAPPPAFVAGIRRTVSAPGPVLLALGFTAYAAIHVSLVALLPTFYLDAGMSIGAAAAMTAVAAAVNVAGNLAAGVAMHRGVSRQLLLVATFAAVGVLALAVYHDAVPLALRIGAALVLSAVAGVIPASLLSGALVHAPSAGLVGATTGLVMQGSQLGQVLGPVSMALVVEATGSWNAAPVVHVVAAVAGIALALRLGRLERTAQTPR